MPVERWGIYKTTNRSDTSHFCQAKCNSIESKNLRAVWLCKLYRASILLFSEDSSGEHTTGTLFYIT